MKARGKKLETSSGPLHTDQITGYETHVRQSRCEPVTFFQYLPSTVLFHPITIDLWTARTKHSGRSRNVAPKLREGVFDERGFGFIEIQGHLKHGTIWFNLRD